MVDVQSDHLGEVDLIPLAQVKKEFSKNKVYSLIKELGIEIKKQGKCSYINSEDYELIKDNILGCKPLNPDGDRSNQVEKYFSPNSKVTYPANAISVSTEIVNACNYLESENPLLYWLGLDYLLDALATTGRLIPQYALFYILNLERCPRLKNNSFCISNFAISRISKFRGVWYWQVEIIAR